MSNQYFISNELITYLDHKQKYTGVNQICSIAASKDPLFCNDTTVEAIDTTINTFADNVHNRIIESIGYVRDSFDKIKNLLWKRLKPDSITTQALSLVIEKLLRKYKRFQTGVGKEMLKCMYTVINLHSGFYCAG